MNNTITPEKVEKYFSVTNAALGKAQQALNKNKLKEAKDALDMAQRYYDDAHYFLNQKKDAVLAFAALNYAHGWLDAGARLGLFQVHDSSLFTVDAADETERKEEK